MTYFYLETMVDVSDVEVGIDSDVLESFIEDNSEDVLDHIGSSAIKEWARENDVDLGGVVSPESLVAGYEKLDGWEKIDVVVALREDIMNALVHSARGVESLSGEHLLLAVQVFAGEMHKRLIKSENDATRLSEEIGAMPPVEAEAPDA